jgi:hypothetical protein
MIAGLGIILFLAALLALGGGFIILIIGAVSSNKKALKIGLYFMLGGAVSLLVSLALCSTEPINFH